MAVLEAKKIEVNDEIRYTIACVNLVKHKALLFSASSTFFLIISVVHYFNTAMGHAYSLLGYPDSDSNARVIVTSFQGKFYED